jgi:hypothetical protein
MIRLEKCLLKFSHIVSQSPSVVGDTKKKKNTVYRRRVEERERMLKLRVVVAAAVHGERERSETADVECHVRLVHQVD